MKRIAPLCRLLLIAACGFAAYGAVLVGLRYKPLAWLVLAYLTWRRLKRGRGSGWSHGTAHWASIRDMARGGLLCDTGLIFGRVGDDRVTPFQAVIGLISPFVPSDVACRLFLATFLGPRWGSERMVRLKKYVHLATFAPTGRGKGVSLIIPNLLAWPGAVVVTDPKGENFKLTAEHRRKKFKHRPLRLDPFGVCGPGADTFNPLSCIDANAGDFLDLCRDVANMLVVRQGTEHEPHWNDSAELVLTAFIAFVCGCETDPAKRHLGVVRGIVSSPASFQVAVATMQKVNHPVIKRLGGLLEWFKDKELSGVLTTVQRHTQFLDSPPIAASTGSSSFDPRQLRAGNRSLYLILPSDRLVTLAPLMRMWVGMTLRVLARDGSGESKPVLFLIDEAAHLGKIQALEDAVTLMRGMGIRLWFFFQSLGQLKVCYGDKADVMLDNLDTQLFFGTNSYESAEMISRRAGEFTLTTVSRNDTTGWSREEAAAGKPPGGGSRSGGTSHTESDIARRLIKPEEILCLPDDTALILHRNMPVAAARLLRYYDAPEFKKGGTGRQRGGGLAATLAAASMLTLSLGLVSLASNLPEPPQFSGFGQRLVPQRQQIPAYGSHPAAVPLPDPIYLLEPPAPAPKPRYRPRGRSPLGGNGFYQAR